MKKLLISAATIAIIFVATVLILPTFINWNQYREEIASQVRKALGRELNIKGDIKLTILPSPALAINDIHLANVEGKSFCRYPLPQSRKNRDSKLNVDRLRKNREIIVGGSRVASGTLNKEDAVRIRTNTYERCSEAGGWVG